MPETIEGRCLADGGIETKTLTFFSRGKNRSKIELVTWPPSGCFAPATTHGTMSTGLAPPTVGTATRTFTSTTLVSEATEVGVLYHQSLLVGGTENKWTTLFKPLLFCQ